MSEVRFRPHHFLCTVGFEGKGYSEEFVANYMKIARGLRETPAGDETPISVVSGADSICAPCPNRRGDACETEEKISALDLAHARILGIKSGDRITWGEAKERIRNRMTLEKFRSACEPCSWLRSGMCERALRKLQSGPTPSKSLTSLLAGVFFLTLGAAPAFAALDPVSEIVVRQNALRAKIVGKTKASKSAKALARATALIDEGEFAQAVTAAAPAEKDAEYTDHALAVIGLASLFEADDLIRDDEDSEKASGKKKVDWASVEKRANRSLDAWTKIHQSHLYSPWWANAPKEMAKAELEIALSQASRKKNTVAARLYEKTFQRLQLENGLSLVKSRHLDSYGELCQKKKSDICTAWIVRFGNFYSKNSAESKMLARRFPDIVEAAKPYFANSKVTTGYKQKDADEVAFDQAFPLVVEESWANAIEAFKKFLEEYPRSTHRFRARYWLAYSLEKKKLPDEARPHFEQLVRETPLTLYGLMSMLTLKQDPSGRFKGQGAELVERDELQTPIEATRLARAKKLLAAKADRLAAMDLRSLRARDTASGPYLMWLASFASASGAHLTTFSILSDLIARMDESVYTQDGLDLVFPVVEWPLIERLATAAGIDPVLAISLIKQESAFDREAGSSVGATGFMQLMPFTASDVESDVERRDLLELETNVRIGTKYLKRVLDRFKGNTALALSGYNAGPTAADRWVREGRAARSFLEYVEQIPYKETRDYVGTIFRNYVWYQYRLKGVRITSPDVFWPAPLPPASTSPAATATFGPASEKPTLPSI
jgi:soluble lytic murein transglycosylase-like protein